MIDTSESIVLRLKSKRLNMRCQEGITKVFLGQGHNWKIPK